VPGLIFGGRVRYSSPLMIRSNQYVMYSTINVNKAAIAVHTGRVYNSVPHWARSAASGSLVLAVRAGR
jgi:hypothetical protein